MHKVLELELEHTNNDCTCSNKITITITWTENWGEALPPFLGGEWVPM